MRYIIFKDKPNSWPMKFPIFQIDAFTNSLFGGNPAAVVPLKSWLPAEMMQKIVMENNVSETVFYVEEYGVFGLRWFTPEVEVDLCGHATLATAHTLFKELGYLHNELKFDTQSGRLSVRKKDDRYVMNFPSVISLPVEPPSILFEALKIDQTQQVFKSDDYLVVLEKEEEVERLQPNFRLLKEVDARGIIVTAPGNQVDFVSRFFGPQVGINEDPVTGSAHTKLTPYWANRLKKNELSAHQISKRKGELWLKYVENRVEIEGKALTYLRGEIEL